MEMIALLKAAQLVLSMGVIALIWVIFPGVMVIIATGVGTIYVAVAIGAILDNRMSIWTAFVFSTFTAVYSTFGVNRFMRNGFDFLTGHFGQQTEFYFYPYLFLAVFLGAAFVVIAHLASWRWMVSGQPNNTP